MANSFAAEYLAAQGSAPAPAAFLWDGFTYTREQMLAANVHDAEFCEWAEAAQPGEAFNGCRCIAPTTPRPTLGDSNSNVRYWLGDAAECNRHADTLLDLRMRATDATEKAALWAGYCAVRNDRNHAVENLRFAGGLLHLWCVPGVAA